MQTKNIAVFGCSWTQGLKDKDFDNWVFRLSKCFPQHNFYNFAAGGTSIVYHTHLLEQILKSTKFDYKIFQVTSPGRFTWWQPHNALDLIEQKTDNYYCLQEDYGRFVDRINTGTILSKKFVKLDRKKHNFGVEYYKRLTDEQIRLDNIAYVSYIKDKVDFHFYHRKSYEKNSFSILTELGDDKFNKFVIDDGDHFGEEGNQWQADWIIDKLKDKKLL